MDISKAKKPKPEKITLMEGNIKKRSRNS